jgi:hypothetical protein
LVHRLFVWWITCLTDDTKRPTINHGFLMITDDPVLRAKKEKEQVGFAHILLAIFAVLGTICLYAKWRYGSQ